MAVFALLRISGYLLAVAAISFVFIDSRSYPDDSTAAWIAAFLAFPAGCGLDFFLQRKCLISPVLLWLLRGTALCTWSLIVFITAVTLPWDLSLRPEPLSGQGPDTAYARNALRHRFGVDTGEVFHNVYYFLDPTFTGSSYEFLRFDYTNESDLLLRLGGHEPLTAVPPQYCGYSFAPNWWLRPTTVITSAYRLGGSVRLCLEEANHRAYILVIGH